MRNLLLTLSLLPALSAQDLVHYKFDSTCTSEVINYAAGPTSVGNGVLQENSGAPYVPGYFATGLSGGSASANVYNRVSSPWTPSTSPLNGDLTLAFFATERTPVGTALNYICGCTSTGHRLFTNGVAGTGLYFRNIVASGPTGLDLALPAATTDFQALAQAGWVHIALVVDSAAGTADWYVDGSPVLQITGVGPGLINTPGNYLVGGQLTSNECNYDLDEWILSNRAYSPSEILVLSLAPRAADAAYDSDIPSQCGAGNVVLGSSGGTPFAGNLAYTLEVAAATPSLVLLLAGFDRCSYSGVIPLPLDATPILPLLSGCWVVADAPVIVNGVAAGAPALFPLPIPGTAPISGAVFTQAIGLDLSTLGSSMSNGLASSIGS